MPTAVEKSLRLGIPHPPRDSHFPTAATTNFRLHFQCLDNPSQGYILKWLDRGLACWTPTTTVELCEVRLPVQFESELELPGVVGSGGLARAADAARGRIAQLVHGKNVRVVEKVETVGDQVQPEALAKVDAFGNAHVELEETRHPEGIAAQVTNAAVRRRDARNREC